MATVVFLCFGPKLTTETKEAVKGSSHVFLDASVSMGWKIPGERKTRFEKSVDFCAGPLADKVLDGTPVRRYYFAQQPRELADGDRFSVGEELSRPTDISAVLASRLGGFPGGETILLVTDGLWNTGADPALFASELKERGCAVFCLYPDIPPPAKPSEKTPEKKEVAKAELELHICGKTFIRVGEPFEQQLVVRNKSGASGEWSIEARFGDATIQKTVSLAPADTVKVVPLQLPPPASEGIHPLSAKILPRAGEVAPITSASTEVEVVRPPEKSKSKNVLYLTTGLERDYRFVTGAFLANEYFKLTALDFITDAKAIDNLAEASDNKRFFSKDNLVWLRNAKELKSAPKAEAKAELLSKKVFDQADAVIIGKISPEIFDAETSARIIARTLKGANLVFIVTAENIREVGATGLAELLPGDRTLEKVPYCRPKAVPLAQSPLGIEFPSTLPTVGMFKFANSKGLAEREYKPMVYTAQELKANSGQSCPIIHIRKYGLGNVLLVMSGSLWHIEYSRFMEHKDLYRAFWQKLSIHSAFRRTGVSLSLGSPYVFEDGEAVAKIAVDESGDLDGYAFSWSGKGERPTPLKDMPFTSGFAERGKRFELLGYHTATVTDPSGGIVAGERLVCLGKPPEKDNAALSINNEKLEEPAPLIDVAELQRIACAGGGKALPFSKAGEIKAALESGKPKEITISKVEPFIDYPYILLAMLLALSLEWVARRSMFAR